MSLGKEGKLSKFMKIASLFQDCLSFFNVENIDIIFSVTSSVFTFAW